MNKQSIRELIDRIVLKFKSNLNRIKDYINNNPNAKKLITIVLLNVILLIIVFLLFSLGKLKTLPKINPISTPTSTATTTPTPIPTPTPVPLVQGNQTYSIGMKGIPEMYEVWFNTIDPKKDTQTVKLKVRDKIGKIISATATVKTDKLSKAYNLSLAEGTASDGVWTGSWKLNDTFNKNFMITFSANDDKDNKSSVDLTIR